MYVCISKNSAGVGGENSEREGGENSVGVNVINGVGVTLCYVMLCYVIGSNYKNDTGVDKTDENSIQKN